MSEWNALPAVRSMLDDQHFRDVLWTVVEDPELREAVFVSLLGPDVPATQRQTLRVIKDALDDHQLRREVRAAMEDPTGRQDLWAAVQDGGLRPWARLLLRRKHFRRAVLLLLRRHKAHRSIRSVGKKSPEA